MDRDETAARPRLRTSAFLLGGAVLDAVVAPVAALAPRHRVAAAALRAAGLPVRGTYALDVRALARRRRHRRVRALLRRAGPDALVGRLAVDGADALREAVRAGRGAILLTTHGGPPDVVPAVLRLLGFDALHLREAAAPPWIPAPRAISVPGATQPVERAAALLACWRELRAGGLLHLVLDGHTTRATGPAPPPDARVGDVALVAAGGPSTLARLSGAPTFPAVASVGATGRVRVAIGDAVAAEAGRGAEADRADARHLERVEAVFARLLANDAGARFARLRFELRRRTWAPAVGAADSDPPTRTVAPARDPVGARDA